MFGNGFSFRRVGVIVLVLASSVGAQPMADRVPADALIYVGWRGAASMPGGYEGSHLQAMLQASDIPAVFERMLPQALARVEQEDEEAAAALRSAASVASVLWKHPSAFYFGGVGPGPGGQPMPRLALLIQADAAAGRVRDEVKKLLRDVPAPLRVVEHGQGTVIISLGPEGAIDRLNGAAAAGAAPAALKGRAEFRQAMAGVHKDPVTAVYVDIEGIVTLFDQFLPVPPEAAAEGRAVPTPAVAWKRAKAALGLGSFKRLAHAGGFEGKSWSSSTFLMAPEPRHGLARLLDGGRLSDQVLALVPQTASMAGAFRLNLAGGFDQLVEAVGQLDAGAGRNMQEALAEFRGELGLDLRADLLAGLGPEWAYYTDENVAGPGLLGLVAVNRLAAPEQFGAAMAKFEKGLGRLIAQSIKDEDFHLRFRQVRSGELDIHYLAVPYLAPAWAVHDGVLYLGLQPQVVAAAGEAGGRAGKSILDNPDFARLRQQIRGGGPISAFSYMDLPRTVGGSYSTNLLMTRLVAGFADMMGVDAPALMMPTLPQLRRHLAPTAQFAWSDAQGSHVQSHTPFPGALLMASDQSVQMAGVAYTGAAVAIVLPAMSNARQVARRTVSMSNLRQMGVGMMIYAADHDGFPPDLGTLIKNGTISMQVCIDPRTGKKVPVHLRTLKDQAVWINDHADYVYRAGKVKPDSPPNTILMYEKLGPHNRQSINILFADGHVESVNSGRARRLLRQAGEPIPPRLD
ncbi:MAG: DUF1559 domain-containing protein [Phycisphaerae bacterium]|nr:DUF1559 domain-containing protein [Phycisphaerae bacterium]